MAQLKSEGKMPKEISDITGIPYETVRYHFNEKRKEKNAAKVSDYRRKLKEKAISYSGGKCVACGYNKCNSSLSFHHLDPSQKDFGLNSKGQSRSWDRCRSELDKTIMVCNNCHGEIHEGVLKVTDIMIKEQDEARKSWAPPPHLA